jgi:hypothetical protein
LGKASINSQNDDLEDVEAMDFDLSQSGVEVGQENQGEKKKSFDEEMIDDDSTLEKEKEEMKKIDKNLEEKTQKLAQMIGIQQGGHKISQPGMERWSKFLMVEKHSFRVTDKETKIIDKAQDRKIKTNELGKNYNLFSILNIFQPSHFVNVA